MPHMYILIYIYIIYLYIYIYPRGRRFPEGGGWDGVGCNKVHVTCVKG